MKTLRTIALILTLGTSLPLYSQTQKYHDSALEEAKGPVKTIKYENRTLEYGPDGALLTLNGKNPFVSVDRNTQGYVTNTTAHTRLRDPAEGVISKDFHRYTYANQERVATDVWICDNPIYGSPSMTLDMYHYDQNGLCVKIEVYNMDEGDTDPKWIWYYEHVRVDERGNWTERNYRVVDQALQAIDPDRLKALGYKQSDVEKRGTETRTITYYDNLPASATPSRQQQPARPATPAAKPQNVSIIDFVRHPFALASLSGNATYNEAKTAVNSQNWAIYHPDDTAYITCYSNDGYNMAYQGHLPYEAQAYFLDNGKINSWSYAFYFSKEQYDYETIHALALRMKQELQQAGITLSPIQANFLYVVESNGIRLLMDKNTNEWLIYLSIRK